MAKYDPSDPEQVKGRKQRVRLRRATEIEDVAALLAIAAGRRFLWRLLSNAGVYRPLFALNSLEIARNAAEHDWCQWLVVDLNKAEPGIIFTLAAEFQKTDEDGDG